MQPRVLFLTSNGAGLGHLTRSMAIARRLPSGIQPVFLTLSQALPVLVEQGFHAEYVPSAAYTGLEQNVWSTVFARRLRHVLAVYDPAVAVFDGIFPYRGLREVMQQPGGPAWIWNRRAMWRPSNDVRALRMSALFDRIIEPGEFAADADRGATVERRHEAVRIAPVTLLDEEELLDREEAAAALGLSPDRTNVLVQLGAGNINDIHSEAGLVLDRLRRWPDTQVVLAESVIAGASVPLPPDVRRARTYPLSRLFRAFDLTVTASGYNTFHEAIAFALPAVFVPNEATAVDDQVARASYAESVGVGMNWQPRTAERLDTILERMRDPEVRQQMTATMKEHAPANGAHDAVDVIAQLLTERMEAAPRIGAAS